MKEFLSHKGVQVEEVDVSADLQARERMVKLAGRPAVPTTVIGDAVIVGFEPAKLEAALAE